MAHMDYIVLGDNIKKARKAANITQEQLAECVNLSTAFISQIERGVRKPSLETVYSISLALRVSMDNLLKDIADMQKTDDFNELSLLLTARPSNERKFIINIVKNILANMKQLTTDK